MRDNQGFNYGSVDLYYGSVDLKLWIGGSEIADLWI